MPVIRTHGITLKGGNARWHLTLIPLCDAHLPYLYKWNSDPEVLYWTEDPGYIEVPRGEYYEENAAHLRLTREEYLRAKAEREARL